MNVLYLFAMEERCFVYVSVANNSTFIMFSITEDLLRRIARVI